MCEAGKDSSRKQYSPPRRGKNQFNQLLASMEHICAINANKGNFKEACPNEQLRKDNADCQQLKQQIEELIRNGKITEWVLREVENLKKDYSFVPPPIPERNPEPANAEKVPQAGSIHYITYFESYITFLLVRAFFNMNLKFKKRISGNSCKSCNILLNYTMIEKKLSYKVARIEDVKRK